MNERVMESKYMQWAKTRSFPYNLAVSGLTPYSIKDLGVTLEDMDLSGPTFYGYEPLQNALAAKAGVPSECVVAATGTSMANHLVMAALLQPGDEVLIESPAYEPILAVAHYLGTEVKRFERRFENGFRVEPQEIERRLSKRTRLIVMTNLHNPSGVKTENEVLKEIIPMARKCGARVLVDEVYLESLFLPSGTPLSAFHLSKKIVVTSSLTKAYGLSGLRCGWILADPDLAKQIWHLNDLFAATPAHAAERLSVAALNKLDEIGNRARMLLETNRHLLRSYFDLEDRLEVVFPIAGTVAFPKLKSGDADGFCNFLAEEYQTGVVPGSFFGMPDHFRLGIGCASEVLVEGLRRISAALLQYSPQSHKEH